MDGALSVFAKMSSDQVTMADIARESGFGKATLYYYFKSKEEIINALLIEGWQELWDCIEPVLETGGTAKETFILVLQTIGNQIEKKRSLYTFLFNAPNIIPVSEGKIPEWKMYQDRLYTVLRGILEEGIAKAEFPRLDSGILMRGIGGLFHGLFFLGSRPRTITKDHIETMLNGIFSTNEQA